MGYQIAKWLKCEKKSWILWMEFLNTKVLELPKWLIIEHICWILIWEYHKFGQCCDIQKSGIKFGAISELKFARNSILLKVHVSKWYRKCFWTMLNYGLMSGKNTELRWWWWVCRFARANIHFFQPIFLLDFAPEYEICSID